MPEFGKIAHVKIEFLRRGKDARSKLGERGDNMHL